MSIHNPAIHMEKKKHYATPSLLFNNNDDSINPADEDDRMSTDADDDEVMSRMTKLQSLRPHFLERLRSQNENENINERTPEALKAFSRRRLEVGRLKREKLKEVVRSFSSGENLGSPSGSSRDLAGAGVGDFSPVESFSRTEYEKHGNFRCSPRIKRPSDSCYSPVDGLKRLKLSTVFK